MTSHPAWVFSIETSESLDRSPQMAILGTVLFSHALPQAENRSVRTD